MMIRSAALLHHEIGRVPVFPRLLELCQVSRCLADLVLSEACLRVKVEFLPVSEAMPVVPCIELLGTRISTRQVSVKRIEPASCPGAKILSSA